MILFYPNLGVPLHIGHMLTYALGWFTAHAKGEKIAVMPDVDVFVPADHVSHLTLGELERLWQLLVSDFDLVGLPPDKVFDMHFVARHQEDRVAMSCAKCIVRGMDLYPEVMSGELVYEGVESLFGPLITIEPYVKLSSSLHSQMFTVPWAVRAFGTGLDLVRLYWSLLQHRWCAPKTVDEMVQLFDPARVSLEPIDFHILPTVVRDRYVECIHEPLMRTFRENIKMQLARELRS